ncbi:hypothetical protein KC887_01750 [Candidatus Kaiserbacteria bacterium]|nr:hypothetical protein [Candidatus Kaiserbacteria bacterium]
MTSEIDELGICLTDKRFLSLSHVPTGTETLYICGNLAGETKRSASFRLNYNTKNVFYIHPSPSLKPGEFFIPVKASSLHGGVESDTFPMGDYQLQAAYSRDPLLFFDFRVE